MIMEKGNRFISLLPLLPSLFIYFLHKNVASWWMLVGECGPFIWWAVHQYRVDFLHGMNNKQIKKNTTAAILLYLHLAEFDEAICQGKLIETWRTKSAKVPFQSQFKPKSQIRLGANHIRLLSGRILITQRKWWRAVRLGKTFPQSGDNFAAIYTEYVVPLTHNTTKADFPPFLYDTYLRAHKACGWIMPRRVKRFYLQWRSFPFDATTIKVFKFRHNFYYVKFYSDSWKTYHDSLHQLSDTYKCTNQLRTVSPSPAHLYINVFIIWII